MARLVQENRPHLEGKDDHLVYVEMEIADLVCYPCHVYKHMKVILRHTQRNLPITYQQTRSHLSSVKPKCVRPKNSKQKLVHCPKAGLKVSKCLTQ